SDIRDHFRFLAQMTSTADDDNTPLPGTVFTPRQVRKLKIAVIVMGVLLVGGFVAVIAAIVYQAGKLGDKQDTLVPTRAPVTAAGGAFILPVGAEIMAMALDGDRLALHVKGPEGAEIVVIDTATGAVVSRVGLGSR
ncbi:MAG: DUF6476 family protein, partial [Methyloligellaceae bacterium]